MSNPPDSNIPKFIEFHFSGLILPTLDKIVCREGGNFHTSVSICADGEAGEAYFKFKECPAIIALCILNLRALKLKAEESSFFIPTLFEEEKLLAGALIEELLDRESWLRQIFGNCSYETLRKIFCVSRLGTFDTVSLNPHYIESVLISLVWDNVTIYNFSDLTELEKKILSKSFAPVASNNRVVPLHPNIATDEVKFISSGEVSPKILELFSAKLEERLIKNGIGAVQNRLEELSKRELPYHLSQHTEIELLANDDWKISFEFELINSGFLPISKRTSQYWFERPQGDVTFEIRDEFGKALKYDIVKSSDKYRELTVHLPRPLNALEKFKYKITYQLKGEESRQDGFYYLSPRTLTKKIALTIKRFDNCKFVNPRVAVETEGGFHKDDVPELTVTNENGIEVLHWTQKSPKPGELFRTLWSNYDPAWDQTQPSKEKKDNVISFPDRNRNLEH